MKKIIILFFAFSLFGEEIEKKMDLSSKKAIYDGNTLELKGKTSFHHPLGTITAKKVIANDFSKKKSENFSTIILDQNVLLTLKKGGSIESEKALYNSQTQKIDFLKNKKKIEYKNSFNQKGKKADFILTCNKAFCKTSLNNSEWFNFYDDVHVKIAEKIDIKGERGIIFQDDISLFPIDENSFCSLEAKKLKINTASIKMDCKKGEITLQKPEGVYDNLFKFCAKSLVLEENKLSLQEDVLIVSEENHFTCPKMDLFFNEKGIEKIQTSANVKINFLKNKQAQITSSSPLFFDPLKKEIFTPQDSSIVYQDGEMTIFAKKIYFYFDEKNKLKKAVLEKDVYFTSKAKNINSYGLADKIVYIPATNFISLEGIDKKVLFFRNDNTISLSADKIEIFHKKGYLQDKVKGIGTVRFTLNPDEKKLFSEQFLKYIHE